MQPDGYVKIKDRSKDVIISGGENISSLEVEDVLYRHPAVLAAAVVAQPDPKWGETPCAFVELKPDAQVTEAELIAHCQRSLARFKAPKKSSSASCPRRRPARSRSSCCASGRSRRRRSSDSRPTASAYFSIYPGSVARDSRPRPRHRAFRRPHPCDVRRAALLVDAEGLMWRSNRHLALAHF
jgi:hypothetical protein